MSWQTLLAIPMALAVLAALWRSLVHTDPLPRRLLLAAGQIAAAALLWGLLFPPELPWRSDALTVLTPGRAELRPGLPWTQSVVALPGAEAPARIERVPDLATALRRHPQARQLEVIGQGLPLRDQPAARGLALRFTPDAARGFVSIEAAARSTVGRQWRVDGVVAPAGARLELRDPAGAIVDSTVADAQGRYTLSSAPRATGLVRYGLRVLDANKAQIDQATLPLVVDGGVALKALLRAAAPSPELKYWRRWALDAGVELQASIGLSDGLALRDGDAALTPDALAKTDFTVIDERSWLALPPDEKAALLAAVEQGMGLLLRVTAQPDAAVVADWTALGFSLQAQDQPHGASLDRALAMHDRQSFSFAPLALVPGQSRALLSDDTGAVVAAMVDRGAGRIALWTPLDTYRLVLQGEAGRYGSLWADVIGEIARSQPRRTPRPMPPPGWVGERQVFCDLPPQAAVAAAQAPGTELLVDRGCAAYWPAEAGWHALQADGDGSAFYVRPADDAVTLRQQRDRQATEALAAATPATATTPAEAGHRALPRWPLLLAWLLVAGGVWWAERRRFRTG